MHTKWKQHIAKWNHDCFAHGKFIAKIGNGRKMFYVLNHFKAEIRAHYHGL